MAPPSPPPGFSTPPHQSTPSASPDSMSRRNDRISLNRMLMNLGSRRSASQPSSSPAQASPSLPPTTPTEQQQQQQDSFQTPVARQKKRNHHAAFGAEDEADEQRTISQLVEASSSRAPPSSVATVPATWAPTLIRGDRPVNWDDTGGAMETAFALATALKLPTDMAKEAESSLNRLEKTSVSWHKGKYFLFLVTSMPLFVHAAFNLPSLSFTANAKGN